MHYLFADAGSRRAYSRGSGRLRLMLKVRLAKRDSNWKVSTPAKAEIVIGSSWLTVDESQN